MVFAQLTSRESLRETVFCLNTVKSLLYHLGFCCKLSRNTLADANSKRNWRIFATTLKYGRNVGGENIIMSGLTALWDTVPRPQRLSQHGVTPQRLRLFVLTPCLNSLTISGTVLGGRSLFYRFMQHAVATASVPYRQLVDGNHKM